MSLELSSPSSFLLLEVLTDQLSTKIIIFSLFDHKNVVFCLKFELFFFFFFFSSSSSSYLDRPAGGDEQQKQMALIKQN
jgi:hypothetical protein